jgi:mono/diheme cytochrome c family protein
MMILPREMMIQDRLGAHLRTQYTIRPWKRSITVSRLMKMAIVSGTTLVTTIAALSGSAGAQTDSASIQAGRQLADTQCAQCHGVDRKAQSTNPSAPAFEDIANVPGMTATALTVALRTSHQLMPNIIVQGRDAENIIAYILSLKRTP